MKLFRKVMSIVFPVFGVMFCFILLKSVAYNLTKISNIGTWKIGIIGSADIHTLNLFLLPTLFMILEILFILSFSFFNITFAFKHKQSSNINWLLLGLMSAIIVFYIVIPPQTYATSVYATIKFFLEFNALFLALPFMYTCFGVTLLTLISLLQFKRKDEKHENI